MSSSWHHFYEFWVGQQTIPGNVLPDLVIGAATYTIGKYKVAPWLHRRHKEQMEQKERHHREVLDCHKALVDLHNKHHDELVAQHQQLLAATKAGPDPQAPSTSPSGSGLAAG